MPRRTGQPTLTDERRKYDARRLYARYNGRYEARSSVKSFRKAFPGSTANNNSARIMWGDKVRWYRENFPDEMHEFAWSLCPDWMLRSSSVELPPRRMPPRGRTESERRLIKRASWIIILFCVMRCSLEECWRLAVPGSTNNPNSARILAQRTANRFIRKYPGAAQLILDDFVRREGK